MPKKPMKSTRKVAPSKVTKPSKMSSTSSKKMASKYGQTDPIGPQTKRESRQSDKKSRVLTPMAPPKVNRSIETPETKAAKRKSRLKTAGTLVGVLGTAVGSVLADARFNRGADRVRGNRNIKVSPRDAWRAGKNKKSTKR